MKVLIGGGGTMKIMPVIHIMRCLFHDREKKNQQE
jgi:hypothetical protein